MKPAIAIAAIAVALAGCNAPTGAIPTPGPKLTIGQVAQGDFTTACQTFNVAVGYYDDVALFVPASAQATASLVIDAGHAICSVPPANVNAALTKLDKLWTKIQALTTIK
jgi:hypothetical protein